MSSLSVDVPRGEGYCGNMCICHLGGGNQIYPSIIYILPSISPSPLHARTLSADPYSFFFPDFNTGCTESGIQVTPISVSPSSSRSLSNSILNPFCLAGQLYVLENIILESRTRRGPFLVGVGIFSQSQCVGLTMGFDVQYFNGNICPNCSPL